LTSADETKVAKPRETTTAVERLLRRPRGRPRTDGHCEAIGRSNPLRWFTAAVWLCWVALVAGCYEKGNSPPPLSFEATFVSSRFYVAPNMRASYEMQLSGEPMALFLGYNLCGFDRTLTLTDQYSSGCNGQYVTDPLGYALAVESYEYSRQPVNNVGLESGAGLSLQFGPVLNPDQVTGDAAFTLLSNRFQQFAAETNTGGPQQTNLILSPAPGGINPANPYGWPGLWMEFAEFADFDPGISPQAYIQLPIWKGGTALNTCSLSSGSISYGAGLAGGGGVLVGTYECDYTSLNLSASCEDLGGAECRDSKVNKVLLPEALGYAAWTQASWCIGYWGSLRDTAGHSISQVDPADRPLIGQPGNQVVGRYPDSTDPNRIRTLAGSPGVYFGDIPMDGWQGLTMMEELDNKSQLLLGSVEVPDGGTVALLSSDGVTLQGAPSIAAADAYSYDSPLLYFPAAVAVVEQPTTQYPIENNLYFPQPVSTAILDGSSSLAALSGLIGGFSEAFALTDRNNAAVGGSLPFEATFDGDPFPEDDGKPDGEATLHDRTLGILKIALVDLDRLHFDPVHRVLVDSATVKAGSSGAGVSITRGTRVTTVELAESIVSLRNAYRALTGSLQAATNITPDIGNSTSALDAASLNGAPFPETLTNHLRQLISQEADFLATSLVGPSGAVSNGYDLSSDTADPTPTVLESETGAIRGLLEAYLATSNESYRDLAATVYQDLQARFWMTDVRCFRTTAGVDDLMQFTPVRFGLLSGALRAYYELVASDPSDGEEATLLLAQIKRMYKLVLNGWDDVNQDNRIQYPAECNEARLEMGERALTGELGHPGQVDRDSDCVKEISNVRLPAALGAELDLSRR
jgi:hypothetical protein